MTESTVPPIMTGLGDGRERRFIPTWLHGMNWIETTFARSVKKNPLRSSILDKKIKRMNFNANIVIRGESISR